MFTGIDELGNLTFDVDKAWTYTWDGRQLVYIVEDGGSPQFTFDYNADGIRTRKGVTDYGDEWTYHSYTLDGTTILKETIYFESYGVVENSRDIYYYYDENGAPLGLNWNNTDYYYYKNIFGDILGIMDANGDMVVRYAYDAWGNPISVTGSKASTLGQDNPFRYRGYYYDTETGLYYLNARYYNPEWGRFISPDPALDISSTLGCNFFAYCRNDPVNYADYSGKFWIWIAAIVVGAVCTMGLTASTPPEADQNAIKVNYDVPLYDQGKTSLCWAYCQTMIEAFQSGVEMAQSEAEKRAKELAIATNGASEWNKGNMPPNRGEKIEISDINHLYSILVDCGPVYAGYWPPSGDGHLVVVTGVNVTYNLVYVNNPWGYAGKQSYDDFLDGVLRPWYVSGQDMVFKSVWVVE